MAMQHEQEIPVKVSGLLSTPAGYGVLLVHGAKVIVIFVDQSVGGAIALALQGEQLPRPLTHDLFGLIFAGLDVHLLKVVINDLREGTFYARLFLEQRAGQGSNYIEVDARPSDCIALALRLKAPLFVRRGVWEEAEDMSWALRKDGPGDASQQGDADDGKPRG